MAFQIGACKMKRPKEQKGEGDGNEIRWIEAPDAAQIEFFGSELVGSRLPFLSRMRKMNAESAQDEEEADPEVSPTKREVDIAKPMRIGGLLHNADRGPGIGAVVSPNMK